MNMLQDNENDMVYRDLYTLDINHMCVDRTKFKTRASYTFDLFSPFYKMDGKRSMLHFKWKLKVKHAVKS